MGPPPRRTARLLQRSGKLWADQIDSLPRKLDADRTMLLLSPRRPGSPWSRLNKQRVEKLIADNLMMPRGVATVEQAKQDGLWTIYDEIEDLIIPSDLAAALAEDEAAAPTSMPLAIRRRKASCGGSRARSGLPRAASAWPRLCGLRTTTSRPTIPKRARLDDDNGNAWRSCA